MSNQGLNVMSKIFIINKNTMKLKELKKIIDNPKLFISEYFAQLINDVDLESEILLLDRKNRNTFKKQQEITKNREVIFLSLYYYRFKHYLFNLNSIFSR